MSKLKRSSRFGLLVIAVLIALHLSGPGLAFAQLDPNPPTYNDPPSGPAFQPFETHLPTGPIHQKFGIATHPWWLDLFFDQFVAYFKDLHATSLRLPFNWNTLEPSEGVYNWDLTDRLLNRLNDQGFEVVAEFVTVPPWASRNYAECLHDDVKCDPDPRFQAHLTEVAQAVARRYPYIRYWEFWNEPDEWPHMGQNAVEVYAGWLKAFYDGIKKVDPTLQVAITSLSGPAYTQWMYDYCDYAFKMRPWDAVAYHPYLEVVPDPTSGQVLSIRKNRVDQLRQVMVEHGDINKPIWLTEVGWQQSPEKQSILLKDAFDFVARRPYITMVHLHMLHDWDSEKYGLLKVKADIYWKRPLNKDDQFEPKQPFYDTYKYYDKRLLPTIPLAGPNVLVFDQTKHTVRDEFKRAWEQGGLALFGFPKTGQFYERNPTDGQYYLVQYFERVRMEYHPENAGTPYEVLYGLLGKQLLAERSWYDQSGRSVDYRVTPEIKPAKAGGLWFDQTGHGLSGAFLTEWQRQGGLSIVGLPISQTFEERNPDDGQTYLVQYFERARAELHPGQLGQPPYVVFGLLGNEVLRQQHRLTTDNQPIISDYFDPAQPEFS